jgi:hypothetical protein
MEERVPSKWSPKLSPDATGFLRFPAIRNIVPLSQRWPKRCPKSKKSFKQSMSLGQGDAGAPSDQTFGWNDFAQNLAPIHG